MATFQDLEGAMSSLRVEISGIVAPQIAASVTGLRSEIDVRVSAALGEVRTHGETITQRVSVAVEERFQNASAGFSAEQARLNGLMHVEHERLTQAHAATKQLLAQLKAEVDATVEKMAAVSDGKLEEVAASIIEQRAKYRLRGRPGKEHRCHPQGPPQ